MEGKIWRATVLSFSVAGRRGELIENVSAGFRAVNAAGVQVLYREEGVFLCARVCARGGLNSAVGWTGSGNFDWFGAMGINYLRKREERFFFVLGSGYI